MCARVTQHASRISSNALFVVGALFASVQERARERSFSVRETEPDRLYCVRSIDKHQELIEIERTKSSSSKVHNYRASKIIIPPLLQANPH